MYNILPKPKTLEMKEGSFILNHKAYLVVEKSGRQTGVFSAEILKKCIQQEFGLELPVIVGTGKTGDIELSFSESLKKEAYELEINKEGIHISGSADGSGVFYAIQTLCQLLEQCEGEIPCMHIWDEPDIPNRGYYFDQTRGRVLKLEELKKIADRMSRYKLNQLQLYVEHTYLFRDFSEMWRDQTPLTAEEILELDSYCAKRHIELVPSLSSFGHLYMLLSTRTYGDLCEMKDSWKLPFSFWDRMRYHTINVSDDHSLELVKQMIQEYMQLFTSKHFNICADETFYLGKEKSKELAEEKGVQNLYIDYVKELCSFLVENGKIPMFWGDIICRSPELIHKLPESTICLNWGYAPNQREYETQVMAEAGATQYLCPGVAGWNQWVNLIENCYKNITLMCGYARKYQGIGVLNTDWGDFGHVNQPEFSVPGMIYGAAFSWNSEKIEFDEINRQISCLEYKDESKTYVENLAQLCECSVFQWRETVLLYEQKKLKQKLEEGEELFRGLTEEQVLSANEKLSGLYCKLLRSIHSMKNAEEKNAQLLSVTIEGIKVWNQTGLYMKQHENAAGTDCNKEMDEAGCLLAESLENWFMAYKNIWRKTAKEGDLHHISEIVFWYADSLRGK